MGRFCKSEEIVEHLLHACSLDNHIRREFTESLNRLEPENYCKTGSGQLAQYLSSLGPIHLVTWPKFLSRLSR